MLLEKNDLLNLWSSLKRFLIKIKSYRFHLLQKDMIAARKTHKVIM